MSNTENRTLHFPDLPQFESEISGDPLCQAFPPRHAKLPPPFHRFLAKVERPTSLAMPSLLRFAVLGLTAAQAARAWGRLGHATVAYVAQTYLTSEAASW